MTALVPQPDKLPAAKPLRKQITDDLRRPLAMLFSGYNVYTADEEEAERKTAFYLLALSDLPEWAVTEAVVRFGSGKVDRRNRDRMPTAEQIAAEAREILDHEAERKRLRKLAEDQQKEQQAAQQARANRPPAEARAEHVRRLLGRSVKSMQE